MEGIFRHYVIMFIRNRNMHVYIQYVFVNFNFITMISIHCHYQFQIIRKFEARPVLNTFRIPIPRSILFLTNTPLVWGVRIHMQGTQKVCNSHKPGRFLSQHVVNTSQSYLLTCFPSRKKVPRAPTGAPLSPKTTYSLGAFREVSAFE